MQYEIRIPWRTLLADRAFEKYAYLIISSYIQDLTVYTLQRVFLIIEICFECFNVVAVGFTGNHKIL